MWFTLLSRDLILEITQKLKPREIINFALTSKSMYKLHIGEMEHSASYNPENSHTNVLQLLKEQHEEKRFPLANIFIEKGHLPPKFYDLTPLWHKIFKTHSVQVEYFLENRQRIIPTLSPYNELSLKDIISENLSAPNSTLEKIKTLCIKLSKIINVSMTNNDAHELASIIKSIITPCNLKEYENFVLQPNRHCTEPSKPLTITTPSAADLYRLFEYAIACSEFREELINAYGNEPGSINKIIAQLCKQSDLSLTTILKLKTFTLMPSEVISVLSTQQWQTIKNKYPAFEKALAKVFFFTQKPRTFYQDEIPEPGAPELYQTFITRYINVIMDDYSQIRSHEIATSTPSFETTDMETSPPPSPSPP